MKRTLLLILAAVVLILLGGFGFLVWYFLPDSGKITQFIDEHPDQVSYCLIRNGEVAKSHRAKAVGPLASTVKIVVAIEYAEQAAAGLIDPDAWISLDSVNRFYLPDTDGGAQPGWLASISEKTQQDQVQVREIAKGMIQFSSNANTEWLMDRLGYDSIQARLVKLGLQDHTEIHYIVSALLVGKVAFPGLKGSDLVEALRNMDMSTYRQYCHEIHAALKADTLMKQDLGDFSMPVQRVWSDRLPASSPETYARLVRQINQRTFDPAAQVYLSETMERLMENPANQSWLKHAGQKGGSTGFVLTKAMYATTLAGESVELAYFFHDLDPLQVQLLSMSMNAFELEVLQGNW
ncbi:serine hydrolase [Pontibacter sp. G13]|uniref:serine hydrolase n=1 Tax=Pontibacter sp. G13 TaxID=3074898 RepID=UPI0028898A05|nr:serine hydrolase [Pontibacter sp. G13]WNJ18179.1 serine hydrolase [Pontibacter sp. G13]